MRETANRGDHDKPHHVHGGSAPVQPVQNCAPASETGSARRVGHQSGAPTPRRLLTEESSLLSRPDLPFGRPTRQSV